MARRILNLLLIFGVSCAVFPGVGDEIREPKWLWLFGLGAINLLLDFSLTKKHLREMSRDATFLILFLGVCVHSVIRPNGYLALGFCVAFFVLWLLSKNLLIWLQSESRPAIYRLGAALTLLGAAFGVLQFFEIDPIFALKDPDYSGLPVGLLGHHTIFGAWMAMMGAWHLARKEWKLFIVAAACVVATRSSFSLISLVAAGAVWALIKFPRKKTLLVFYGVSFLALAIKALYFSYGGFFYENGRFLAWRQALVALEAHPWFGYGILSFGQKFFRYQQGFRGHPFIQAHNELLQWAYETGIFGLAIISPLISDLISKIRVQWKDPEKLPALLAFTAVSVNSFGNFPLHIAPLALGWMIALHDIRSVSAGRQA